MDTNIRINVKTKDRLATVGVYGDTMDSIINRCIDAYLKAQTSPPGPI